MATPSSPGERKKVTDHMDHSVLTAECVDVVEGGLVGDDGEPSHGAVVALGVVVGLGGEVLPAHLAVAVDEGGVGGDVAGARLRG